MSITQTALMQQRRDTAANWTSANPTLLAGEIGIESDTNKIKLGTGSASWTALGYTTWSQVSAYPLVNADIASAAAIAYSKLATLTSGNIVLGSSANVATSTAVTGDVTISNAGVTAIATGVIVNADINASAAIVDTKLATIATAGKVSNSATTATDSNTASAIVARDASGNFTAGTITAALTGAASSNVLKAGDTMTGALVVPLASAATPSLTFTGDLDTGVFSPGANQVAVATNGVARLTTSTTAVSSSLAIDHPLGAVGTPSITFTGDLNTGFYSPAADTLAAVTAGSNRLHITSGGLVGIGTSTVDEILRINGASNGAARLRIQNQGTTIAYLGSHLGIEGAGNANDLMLSTGSATNLTFGLNGSEKMRLTSTGLGIGSTGPSDKLSVAGSSATDFRALTLRNSSGTVGSAAVLTFEASSGTEGDPGVIAAQIKGVRDGAGTNGGLEFWTANSGLSAQRARVDSSGRLLVGTSTARVFDSSTGTLTPITQIESTGAESAFSITRNTATATGPGLFFGKSRSASIGGITVVQDSDKLGTIFFEGTDGTNLIEAATIFAEVDGTPGANDMPGRLVFSTTADGASTPTERMRITSAGVLQIADAGNITVGTTTGTKIGTATTQKIGFYNATPVVQPTAVADATTAVDVITQLNNLLAKLRTLGIIAT